MWVGGIDDYGCGSVVSMIVELVFLLFFGFFGFFYWVCFFTFFFYWFSLGFRCDRLVWIPTSILLHSGRLEVSILREMVANDGGCVGCVGLKK